MIGVPYIKSLFSAILAQSKVINGRFYICPFWGTEINKLNLDEIISWVDASITDTAKQKYPAALLMPMREVGLFQYQDGSDNDVTNQMNTIECSMVFVTNAYTTGQNQPSAPAAGTNQATHTISDTWHDMARCAKNFLQVLYQGINEQGLAPNIFISEQQPSQLLELTCKGNDGVTGVMMRFNLKLYPGCTLEDYPADFLTAIQWPAVTDVHPLHLDV